MRSARWTVAATLFAVCGTLFAQPARDAEGVVRRLYERVGANDLEGAMALWSPAAPERAAFRARLAGILRVRCVDVRDVRVTRVEVTGAHAAVAVDVSLVKWSRHTAAWWAQTEQATLKLDRDKRGNWLLTGWRRQEETLADALLESKSAEEQRGILAAQPSLVTPALTQVLASRVLPLVNAEKYDDATRVVHLAERLGAELDDVAGLAVAFSAESVILRRRNDADLGASLRTARESVMLAEASGDPDVLALALFRLGFVERWTSDDLGKASGERAIALDDDVEDRSLIANAASGVAEYYSLKNDSPAELHYGLMCLDLAIASGDRVTELTGELIVGVAYRRLAAYALALPHFEHAVALAHATNVTGGIPADTFVEIAHCHMRLGHAKAFLEAIRQARRENHGADEAAETDALINLADYHLSHGNIALAASEAERAVRIGQNFRSPKINAIWILAAVRVKQGRAKDVLALVQSIPGFYSVALAASAYRMLGRRAEAYRALREAADDANRDVADLDETQSEYQFKSFVNVFVDLADMLVEDGRLGEALSVAERAKGRALLHALRGGRPMADAMMTDEERAREHAIEQRLVALNSQAGPLTPERRAELIRARVDLEEYRTNLYAKYPRLKAQQSTPPAIDDAQMAELLGDRSAGFLEFVIGDHRTRAFLVRRSGKGVVIDCRTIRIERPELQKRVGDYVRALAAHDRLYAAPSRALYRLLLAPFDRQLRGVKALCIIPDGALWQLPFESLLRPDGRFFVQRMAVLYAPSITIYREMVLRERAAHPAGEFLAFANPPVPPRGGSSGTAAKLRAGEYAPLPDAAREVDDIAALFGNQRTKVYLGAAALESRAKAESPRYAVVHFATHGVLDDDDPMFSHLLLAASSGDEPEDGLLETWEMMRLDLHANLAVLSACETARGAIHDGEGLIGMAWALSVAGTSSTIVTQWKITSRTAAGLMVDFYRQWLRAPATPFAKAEALRRARVHVLSVPARRHPFYWSAFVLIGAGS